MADHERSSKKHQRGNHLYSSTDHQSRHLERSADYHHDDHNKFSDREHDAYGSHGSSLRTSQEESIPHQGHSRFTDRERHSQSADRRYHRYDTSEVRRPGSIMKHRRWTPHDHLENHSHERFDGVDDDVYGRETGHRTTKLDIVHERCRPYPPIRGKEKAMPHDMKDGVDWKTSVHGKPRHRDNNEHFLQKNDVNYRHKEEEPESQRTRSPASSDVISLKVGHQFGDERTDQRQSTLDRRSEHRDRRSHHHHHHHDSSRGRPSGSSSHSSSGGASGDSEDSRDTGAPKEDYSRRRSSQWGRHRSRSRSRSRSGRRSPSHSRSRGAQSESPQRGRSRRSPSKNHSSVDKYSRSSHSRQHSSKRKHKDRSASRDDRKRRKGKEREREKETRREKEREKEKSKKKDEERRSVLTGKKIKLKVKKDKSDHERDANRKDLLQFLNSAFE